MNEDAKAKLLFQLGQLAQAHPEGSEDYLHQLWNDWNQAQVYRRAGLPMGEKNLDPSALEALEANRQLVQLLEGRRWYVVAEARAQGSSWQQIADALGVTRQSAHAAYRDALERMKKQGLPVSSQQLAAGDEPEPLEGPRVPSAREGGGARLSGDLRGLLRFPPIRRPAASSPQEQEPWPPEHS